MTTFDYTSASVVEVRADLLLLPVFENAPLEPEVAALEKALGVDIAQLLSQHRFGGAEGDLFVFPSLGKINTRTIALAGLGSRATVAPRQVRNATAEVLTQSGPIEALASTLPRFGASSAEAFAEGVVIGSYIYGRSDRGSSQIRRATAISDAGDLGMAALQRGMTHGEATNVARELVNRPGCDLYPAQLAAEAELIARDSGIECRVWDRQALADGGFDAILAVGAGSSRDPYLIELTYQGTTLEERSIALVGKGVTFDAGGLNIKSDRIVLQRMKSDMSGAAAVLAAMWAVGQLRPRLNVTAVIPTVENMPGHNAYRPGDVIRHRNGVTTEVVNTDAEGRMILADALAYAAEKAPRAIVNVGTLSGGFLGSDLWHVLGTDQSLVEELLTAGLLEGEPGWQLPLWEPYEKRLASSFADQRNFSWDHHGLDAILAGLFLRRFVPDTPFAHIDISSTAYRSEPSSKWPEGATGVATRSLIRFIENQSEES